MFRAFFVFFCVAAMLVLADAQLTFTPNWGKRSLNVGGPGNDMCNPGETLIAIYKLIETEAEKMLACQQK
ncbi:hypothetical protein JYU34_005420 [Plutella xylostella]|uniref:Uncharacterized protein n=2 Tax=Plutella xylostella TaxID=51655 RepID=A0ABQ7QWL9_PLUXY|nr:adipokinetic hormone 2 [Plutella xylostella]KAG7309450.1 hypothetical protein JYU34_005420 [Plutella xylostella]CAG9130905.1 unnamed protein product [Plutella xylostella]